MKKNSFLVKTVLMSMLTAVTFSFASCQDDDFMDTDAMVENTNASQTIGDGDILVEGHAYTMPFTVKANGKWRIEQDRYFFTLSEEEGIGPKVIKIYVQDNRYDERKQGHMTIITTDGQGREQRQVLEIVQKGCSESVTRAISLVPTSNRVYSIGYGYSTLKGYNNHNAITSKILDVNKLLDQEKFTQSNLNAEITYEHYTANSRDGLVNAMCDSLGHMLSYIPKQESSDTKEQVSSDTPKQKDAKKLTLPFTFEVGAAFGMDNNQTECHDYAISYLNYGVRRMQIEPGIGLLRKYINEDAAMAINGEMEEYKGKEGVKNLIRDFGTHMVKGARIGGRIRSTLDIKTDSVSDTYDLDLYARIAIGEKDLLKCSDQFKKSYKKDMGYCRHKLNVVGGTQESVDKMTYEVTPSTLDQWKTSIQDTAMVMVGFEEGDLIPIYELASTEARKQEIRNYMEGQGPGTMSADYAPAQTGTVTEIEVPSFDAYSKTLVKNIMLSGERVGIACNEYIPQLNKDERVTVIYPVVNGKLALNQGVFLGDEEHKPSRVNWRKDSAEPKITPYVQLDYGTPTKIYLQGTSVSTKLAQGQEVRRAKLQDAYMEGMTCAGGISTQKDYPLVKIFNRIWTREDYQGEVEDGLSRCSRYYSNKSIARSGIQGWEIASDRDFELLKQGISASGTNSFPILLLQNYGRAKETGFDLKWDGYMRNGSVEGSGQQMQYLIQIEGKNDSYGYVDIKSSGAINIHKSYLGIDRMAVRYVLAD
ncbi:MAG: hypothetical protein IKG81_12235 [Bacteroidales bacterium]|nr:hypothetical protein [Bacteroidales bacterium]